MKIKWSLSLIVLLLITIVPFASAATHLKVFVNGQPIYSIPSIVKIKGGLPFVSIHSISSEPKLDVDYNEKTKTLHISNKGEPQSEVVATLKKAKATLYATKREGYLEKFLELIQIMKIKNQQQITNLLLFVLFEIFLTP